MHKTSAGRRNIQLTNPELFCNGALDPALRDFLASSIIRCAERSTFRKLDALPPTDDDVWDLILRITNKGWRTIIFSGPAYQVLPQFFHMETFLYVYVRYTTPCTNSRNQVVYFYLQHRWRSKTNFVYFLFCF
jgi:hypothetical protein